MTLPSRKTPIKTSITPAKMVATNKPDNPNFGNNAIDDDDEGTCGSSDLHTTASKKGDDQTGDNGGDNADAGTDGVFGISSRRSGDGKGDGKGQRYNAHHKSCHEIGRKQSFTVMTKVNENTWFQR